MPPAMGPDALDKSAENELAHCVVAAALRLAADWTIIEASPLAGSMLGAAPADLAGRSFHDFVHGDGMGLTLRDADLAGREINVISRDMTVIAAGGATLWVRAQIRIERRAEGGPRPTVITLTDIDDLMVGLGRLTHNPQMLDRIFGIIPQVIWISRQADYRNVYVNAAYESVWGRSRDTLELERAGWLESLHPDDRDRVSRETFERREQGLSYTIEYRIIDDAGATRWILDNAFPIRDANGKVDVYMGGALDITEHKQNEIRLGQLQSANNIGSIAADLAHNFNNLLAIIDMSARSVARTLGVAPVQPKLDAIHVAVARGNEITRSLLAISSRQLLHPEALNLHEVIVGLLQLAEATVGPNVKLDYVPTPLLCRVKIDRSGFSQALVNLLTNAREAMGGCGEITIGTRVAEHDLGNGVQQVVEVHVDDNGPGMAEAVLPNACNPYFTTKDKGSGLGLAITNGFVQQSGGWVELTNRSGGGLSVRMMFPRLANPPAVAAPGGGAEPPPARKVLLVDDEPAICDLIRDLLTDVGYDVIAVQSAACAFSVLEQTRFDLLITDLALNTPASGIELAQAVCAKYPQMPIVAITGYARLADGLPKGCEVLTKPFDQEAFLRLVDKLTGPAPRGLARPRGRVRLPRSPRPRSPA
jgi:PAS domain S-box-containing protein